MSNLELYAALSIATHSRKFKLGVYQKEDGKYDAAITFHFQKGDNPMKLKGMFSDRPCFIIEGKSEDESLLMNVIRNVNSGNSLSRSDMIEKVRETISSAIIYDQKHDAHHALNGVV